MDPRVMELRIRQWIPVFEEQGLSSIVFCVYLNGSGLLKDELTRVNYRCAIL